jgi:hypothetical protein
LGIAHKLRYMSDERLKIFFLLSCGKPFKGFSKKIKIHPLFRENTILHKRERL